MTHAHDYTSHICWTGNTGQGTQSYTSYKRSWEIVVPGKPVVPCSNDPLLGGDPGKMNPEDLLLSAVAACHMLWYLHLASDAGIRVDRYEDTPLGHAEVQPDGTGRFLEVVLRPTITVAPGADPDRAAALHGEIHKYCFIARSVNFPVTCAPEISVGVAAPHGS